MDDASSPGKQPELPQRGENLLPPAEAQDFKEELDWARDGLGFQESPIKIRGDMEVAEGRREPAGAAGRIELQQQQQVLAVVVLPKEEKTLGQRFEEMRKTREERDMEKLRRKAQKAKEPRYEEEAE